MDLGKTKRRTRRDLLHSTLALLALSAGGAMASLGVASSVRTATSGATASSSAASAAPRAGATTPASAAAKGSSRQIVVLGDSLSAELGLERGSGWVALLAKRLAEQAPRYTVRNASISGDTTANGLTRLPALLQTKPAIVIIELGANDALRGQSLADVQHRLDQLVTASQAAGARVLVVGIQVPPNYGRQYTTQFAKVFADVAVAHHAALVPFLLAGVADRPDATDWFQADGIHPIAKAHPIILDNVWPALKPLL